MESYNVLTKGKKSIFWFILTHQLQLKNELKNILLGQITTPLLN